MTYRPLIVAFLILCLTSFAAAEDKIDSLEITYVGSTLWSRIERVCTQGDYAYCAAQHGLMVYDLSQISNPQLVSKYFLESGEGKDVGISGNFVYLCCNTDGVRIFDITDPSNPQWVGHYVNGGWRAAEIVVAGTYLYILNSNYEITLLDITVPQTPVLAGTYSGLSALPGFGNINEFEVRGDTLLCASYYGLEIADVSNPAVPDSIGCLAIPGGARAIALYDTLAYLMTTATMYIAGFSDPANPNMIDSVPLGFSSYAVRDMFVIGDYLYTSHGEYDQVDDDGGMFVFDLSDPLNPSAVGHVKMDAWRISNLGDKIGITDLEAYYKILGLADPANPAEVGEFDIPHTRGWGFRGIETDGRYAYVALGPSDLNIVDIRDPHNMIPIGGDFLTGGAFELTLRGKYLYVASGSYSDNGLYIFDVSNPESPQALSYYPYSSPQEITLSGNYAFMAGNHGNSIILDISNAYSPQLVSSYRSGGITWGIAVNGNYAYLANLIGLIIVDITDIDSPVVADTIAETYESLNDAIMYKGWLITGGNGKFKVRDVSTPLSPATVAELEFNYDVNGLQAYGNYILVANYGQFDIVDMSIPIYPEVVGSHPFSGETQDIAYYDGYAFVVDQYGMAAYSVDLPECCLVGGDANFDGEANIGDAVYLLNYIFKHGFPITCDASADGNGDCIVDVGDVVFMINYIVRSGAPPVCSECVK